MICTNPPSAEGRCNKGSCFDDRKAHGSLMGGGVHTKSILQLAREQAETLPSPEALERFGTYNMLALIYDAIGNLVTPVHRLPKVIPALEQIVNSLAEQQGLLKEMLGIQKDAALVRLVADRLERVPSL